MTPPRRTGPAVNREIRAREVRLIDETGANVGIVPLAKALERAAAVGLDLLEVTPNAEPPVCKILDYGKYKYEESKKQSEARKKQHVVETKEIRIGPSIGTHDYELKMRQAGQFLSEGNKVKFSMKFRGREIAHKELGMQVLQRLVADLAETGKVEQAPKMEGRNATMLIAPK